MINSLKCNIAFYVDSFVFDTKLFVSSFKNSYLPDMVWMLILIILKLLQIWISMSLRACIFGHSPTAISHIPNPIIFIYYIIFKSVSYFSEMGMMLKCSNNFTIFKCWCPIFSGFRYNSFFILKLSNIILHFNLNHRDKKGK